MKYRIKIVTFKNGQKLFYPQYKTRLMWIALTYESSDQILIMDCFTSRDAALIVIDRHYASNVRKQTIEFEYIKKD
jgi:hypothetical protein